ncbi:hypothetical protein H632_c674p1 [Helicosporidium sp. ATCC 50920]|nr:hypothetical protein H632_c674p1 [Helicosporidium sp. ATCC 50920]|eukprot:KDD75460.1 hypothetical protein H632_c674p1 [Helicosporidium sp. ATCC 50920]
MAHNKRCVAQGQTRLLTYGVQLNDALASLCTFYKGATRTVQIAQSLRNVLDSLIDLGEEDGADLGSEQTERRKAEKKEKRRKDGKSAGESSVLQNSDEDVTFQLFSRIPETPRQPKSSSKAKKTTDGGECSRSAPSSASLDAAAPTAQPRDSYAGALHEPALAAVAMEGREILSRAASHADGVRGLQAPVSVPKPANERCMGRGKAHVRAQLRLGCLCPHTAGLLGKKTKKKRASSAANAEASAGMPADELDPESMSKQQRKKARRRAAKAAQKTAEGDQGIAVVPLQ